MTMKWIPLWVLFAVVSGCSALKDDEEMAPAPVVESDTVEVGDEQQEMAPEPVVSTSLKSTLSYPDENISDYVNMMAYELVNTSRELGAGSRVGVASFVDMETMNTTSTLGRQLAESFMYELQQHGMAVVDFKTRDTIQVTSTGDFIFSRDFKNLRKQHNVNYILSGTVTQQLNGVLVNVRMINLQTKVLAGTAQAFVPRNVTELLIDSDRRDGVLMLEQN